METEHRFQGVACGYHDACPLFARRSGPYPRPRDRTEAQGQPATRQGSLSALNAAEQDSCLYALSMDLWISCCSDAVPFALDHDIGIGVSWHRSQPAAACLGLLRYIARQNQAVCSTTVWPGTRGYVYDSRQAVGDTVQEAVATAARRAALDCAKGNAIRPACGRCSQVDILCLFPSVGSCLVRRTRSRRPQRQWFLSSQVPVLVLRQSVRARGFTGFPLRGLPTSRRRSLPGTGAEGQCPGDGRAWG